MTTPIAFQVEDWLRELGLPIPISTDTSESESEKRIQGALIDADWQCYSWTDRETNEIVVTVQIP